MSYRRSVRAAAILFAGLVLMGSATTALAQKIGYVDLQRVVVESKVGKAGLEELKAFQAARQKDITVKEQELLKLKQNYETQSIAMNEDARKLAVDKMNGAEIGLKRLLEDSERELRVRRNDLFDRIQRDLVEVINKFGAEQKYTMIFEKSNAILYADPANDVTNELIQRFDKVAGGKGK